MDGRTHRNSPCVLQDFVPFWAAAHKEEEEEEEEKEVMFALYTSSECLMITLGTNFKTEKYK